MTPAEVREVLEDVQFRNWEFDLSMGYGREMLLRVTFLAKDNHAPGSALKRQFGREWLISTRMSRSEIVQTAFLAAMTAMEHEIREQFTYKGVDIFGPHLDVDQLAAAA